MNFTGKAGKERALALDMTPMIDIVFQLLIFFLTTAHMAQATRAPIDLPLERGEQRRSQEEAGMIINVTSAGEFIVSERTVSADELDDLILAALARAPQMKPLIRADRAAPTHVLNALLDRLKKSGVESARLATAPPR
jgi:biopolymer transport protein ExbD